MSKPISKHKTIFENVFLFVVVFVVVVTTLSQLNDSYMKSRDITRKNDLGDLQKRIADFRTKIGYYPSSTEDGRIVGCNGVRNKAGVWLFKPCTWGVKNENSPFFENMPNDPNNIAESTSYFYKSDGKSFKLYARLERFSDVEYMAEVYNSNIPCGKLSCNTVRNDDPLLFTN